MASGYRLAPALAARLLGLALVLVALLVLGLTLLTAALDWSPGVLLVTAAVAVVAVAVAGWLLSRRLQVVTLDEQGYRVRLVRGAGVSAGRWRDVEDAVTADLQGIPCLVLRRKDGRTTSIPVGAVAADKDAFVADVQEHLRRAEGLRPL